MGDATPRISVGSSQDAAERTLQEIVDATPPGQPLRMRFQPTLYKLSPVQGQPSQYVNWRGVTWFLEVPAAGDAQRLREALDAFFGAVGRGVPLAVLTDRLGKMKG